MATLIGVDEITSALQNWVDKNKLGVTIKGISDGFYYHPYEEAVSFSLFADEDAVSYWYEFLNSFNCNLTIDYFYSALMHEIFHGITWNLFTEKEIDECHYSKSLINIMPDSKEKYFKYFNLPIEKVATQRAVEFMNNHISEMKELFDTINPLLMQFYKNNRVEV